jgi:hypothetical protein
MADVVKVVPPTLLEASSQVAQHIEVAAKPPTAAAPLPVAASPVDVAASGAAGAIQTKMAALSTELAPKGPAIQGTASSAAAALQAQDAANAARISDVLPQPSAPSIAAPHIQAVDRTWKKDPPPPPPADPLPGWTDEQKQRVAVEIANGHAAQKHFPGESEPDIARRIYNALTDPRSVGTSTDGSGLVVLGKDGTVVFVKPGDADYGTAFVPQPTPNTSWQTPEEYFKESAGELAPLPPPAPGRLPSVSPGEIAPSISAPPALPSVGQHPAPAALPPTVLDHPPATVLPPTVLDHPPTTALPPQVLDHPPLPPWLLNPTAAPGVVGPPQNPLLTPFPGVTMPAPPPASVPAPGPSLIPHITMPHIDVPPPSPGEGALAGGGLLALLLLGAVALA